MKTLFDETRIGTITLKNRLIRAAAGDRHAVDGHMTEKDIQVYEELAGGGVGTILTGYTYISDYPSSPGMFGIYDDSFIPEFKKLTDRVHQYGANIILQLVQCGSQTRVDITGKKVLGPSAVEHVGTKIMPQEMTWEDIETVQKAFADAAMRARAAGFDGVQVHGAHGFLLSQFLTPYYNRRTDGYGGTDENRARMLVETYQSMRKKVGADFPIWFKINCEDGIDQGITPEGFECVCRKLAEAGVNAIEVSGAWYQYTSDQVFYYKAYAEKIAGKMDAPVILVGGNRDFDDMTSLLNETDIAYFSLCRPLIAEPDLVKRWEQGDTARARCISCNKCLGSGRCILNG